MEIRAWSDVVLCTLIKGEEKTDSGIVLAAEATQDVNKKPDKGIIVNVGKPSDPKKKFPFPLNPGDIIFFERYTKNPVTHKGKDYCFVKHHNIMGVISQ